jgi:alpha-galactosidase
MASESTRCEPGPRLALGGSPLALMADGRQVASVAVTVESAGKSRAEFQNWTGRGDRWMGTAGTLACTVDVEHSPFGVLVRCTILHGGMGVIELRRVLFAVRPLPEVWDSARDEARGLKIAYCGAHSRSRWSRSAAVELTPGSLERSWWVGALTARTGGPGFVLGGADFRRFATAVDLEPNGLTAVQFLEGREMRSGERLETAPLWLGVSRDAPLHLLEAYASDVGRRHGSAPREAPCGWGSWGHFLESIDVDLMRENLLALDSSEALREATRLVQIDDGWSELLESERASASWRPNPRFPSGIAPLAETVRNSGRTCGLWILPFTVNEGSPLAQAHPEYLVRDEHDRPKPVGRGTSFCLDPFHPGSRGWIQDLMGRLRDWGVGYVKLDHLRALLMPDPDASDDDLDAVRRYAASVTRVEAYRRGLELVREALGPDAFVVACSAPAGPSIGLVDALRVGPDIEPRWVGTSSGIRDATRALAANFFWQGRTWVNDPDYLLAGATMDESRFWATAVALCGGSAILSADLGELAPWQEDLFAMVTPPTGIAARPLDLFEHAPEPRLWHLELDGPGGPWHLVGLFNWGERPTAVDVDMDELGLTGAVHVWDVWRRRYHLSTNRHVVFVEAHSAALLALRARNGGAQVVGTDIHFAPGVRVLDEEVWDPTSRTLSLSAKESMPRPGVAYVSMPEGLRLERGAREARADPDLIEVALRPGDRAEVAFRDGVREV